MIICGVSTSYVVESTVRELYDCDFKVTVIADACNAASQQTHEASLANLSRIAETVNIDNFISC